MLLIIIYDPDHPHKNLYQKKKFNWMAIFLVFCLLLYIFKDEYLNIGDNLWHKMFKKFIVMTKISLI